MSQDAYSTICSGRIENDHASAQPARPQSGSIAATSRRASVSSSGDNAGSKTSTKRLMIRISDAILARDGVFGASNGFIHRAIGRFA